MFQLGEDVLTYAEFDDDVSEAFDECLSDDEGCQEYDETESEAFDQYVEDEYAELGEFLYGLEEMLDEAFM